jgi:hypothetical protein
MLHLPPEKFRHILPSDISNLYSFNTVLYQRISQWRRTLNKFAALLPHPSNSASFLRWIIRPFKVMSSNLLRDSNKFLHYYILYHKSSRLSSHSVTEQARRVWPSPLYPYKETLYPLYGGSVGPRGCLVSCKKSSAPTPEFNPQTVKPVVNHYAHPWRRIGRSRGTAPH